MAEGFHGVVPALITPFNKDGSVNFDSIGKIIEMNLSKGVSGFYVGGSTSEAFLLSHEERKKILEAAAEANAGRGFIIAHVGSIGTDAALDLARHAEKHGADALSAVPPFYYGFSFDEIREYYFSIASETSLPVLIYNFAANGGAKLSMDNFEVFLKDSRFLGVKHTSSDMFLLERLKKMRDGVVVFNGFDEMFISGLAAGADGGIGSTYNFMAEMFVEIEKLFRENKIDEARAVQTRANNIIAALLKCGVMPGVKAILCENGIAAGDCRKPFRTLGEADKKELIKVYRENI